MTLPPFLALFLALALTAHSVTLTNTQGISIEVEIVSTDGDTVTVTKGSGTKSFTINLNTLDEASKKRVEDWNKQQSRKLTRPYSIEFNPDRVNREDSYTVSFLAPEYEYGKRELSPRSWGLQLLYDSTDPQITTPCSFTVQQVRHEKNLSKAKIAVALDEMIRDLHTGFTPEERIEKGWMLEKHDVTSKRFSGYYLLSDALEFMTHRRYYLTDGQVELSVVIRCPIENYSSPIDTQNVGEIIDSLTISDFKKGKR